MNALKLFILGVIILGTQGCYTVIWTPDVAFPTKDQSENSDSYYEEIYYGDYSPYYEMPWWYSVPPPPSFVPPRRDRDDQATKLRNGNSPEREPNSPRPPILIGNPGDPINIPPPTISQPVTGEDNASKKSEGTTKEREKSNSSNSRDTRNNDGSRSSDNPRR